MGKLLACDLWNQGSTRHMQVSGMAGSKIRSEVRTYPYIYQTQIFRYTRSSETTMRQPLSTIFCLFLTLLIPPLLIIAHSGGHHDPQQQVLENQETDWATRHMIEEHHISNLDPGAFFSLHDYDSSTAWTPGEILRTYGLDDASSRDVPESKRQEVVRGVLDLFDQNGDGIVSRDEWVVGWGRGEGYRILGYVCLPGGEKGG